MRSCPSWEFDFCRSLVPFGKESLGTTNGLYYLL